MGRWASTGFLAIFITIAIAIAIVMNLIIPAGAHKGLEVGFYRNSCPEVETIVYKSMAQSYKTNMTVAPGVLRLAFHDCFVRGCDAFVLLDGPNTERKSVLNGGLHGYDAVDAAKRATEKACPGIVSAPDVLQFAARDSVILASYPPDLWITIPEHITSHTVRLIIRLSFLTCGSRLASPDWRLPMERARWASRRDDFPHHGGNGCEPRPSEHDPVSTRSKVPGEGLERSLMVVLSGFHTIGKAPCLTFDDRVQTNPVDPTLAPSFAASLKKQCLYAQITSTKVALDSTPRRFDTQYFKDIIQGRGVLISDQELLYDSRTVGVVRANKGSAFYRNFGEAMVAMSELGVLTDGSGEIRRQIDQVNT
ncbi:peroxidase 25-like [Physcomitrium patens]|uniref:peroxidase 25-like n=1 Tax=Physcomitrium patens TaxID=3218 RepID=UPI003CCDC369